VAKAAGYPRISELHRVLRLAAAEDNEQAAALYRRNGFASTGELAGSLPDGIRMEKVMLKQLRPPASHW
jgi:ribosomal protein S18 acetylase RimI-like enzyme